MNTNVLILDFETRSTIDLKKTGVAVYAEHPTTEVVCLAYAFSDEPVQVWHPAMPFPTRLLWHVGNRLPVIAHNAAFERAIWNVVLPRMIPVFNIVGCYDLNAAQTAQDTMIRAAYWGLPRKLEQVAEALNLPFGKDPVGHKAMMKVTKRKPKAIDGFDGKTLLWEEPDQATLDAVYRYCVMDVELERLIHKLLPPLPPKQVEEFIFDAAMNDRGIQIDAARVQWLKGVSDAEMTRLDNAMFAYSQGRVRNTRALAELKAELVRAGETVTDLAKADVAELLKKVKHPTAKALLLFRQEAAKTSTAKLTAMNNAMCADDRVRGVFQFYGATRTGRYAGRLIQPQNYPRPHLKRDVLENEIRSVQGGYHTADLQLVSSALRSCIVAKKDHSLVVVDFAQIEARVLAWLAGQQDILDVFAKGEDVYTYAAKKIGSSDRTLGKVATLGLGYGMGAARFQETALTYGLTLTAGFADSVVKEWRRANSYIQKFWYEIDLLVTQAITKTKGKWLSARTCDIRVGCFWHKETAAAVLLIELPSGRHLAYREPEWDGDEGVSYMGVDQYTKKWTRVRSYGAKFVENIVQAVARDLMMEVLMYADEQGVAAVGTVHDEGIWEEPDETADAALAAIEATIKDLDAHVSWAAGLPMSGEGFVAKRYGK